MHRIFFQPAGSYMAFAVALIIFLAALTQTVTGFGSALVSMALLTQILGIQVAAPLVALMAGTIELVLLVRYRQALKLSAVWRIAVASVVGIPLGLWALRSVSERVVLAVLGLVIIGYAVYALASPRLPEIKQPGWAFGFGFLAGLLGGAYNVSGPPAILYGSSQRWSPAEFKSNLQGFFLLNDALVIAGHALSSHLTPIVWGNFCIAVPAIALGLVAGLVLERFINPAVFRRMVLGLLILVGLRLLF
jgi:uncharacterized membrane protein YfcA